MTDREVVVGHVTKPHGLRGEVAVSVRTDEPARRFAGGSRLVASSGSSEQPRRELRVRAARWQQDMLLVCFSAVDSREAAEELRGLTLSAHVSADVSPAAPEEFYDHQLVGLEVRRLDGSRVGTVGGVEHLPGQDLLLVDVAGGRNQRVPFVHTLVPIVDLAEGFLAVDDRPGLLADDGQE